MARSPPDPDAGGHGSETRHVFCQDGDPVGESGSLNVVNHSIRTQKWDYFLHRGCRGDLNPSTAQKGRQREKKWPRFWPKLRGNYLTALCGVAENEGLFVVLGKVSSPEPIRLSLASKGTLVAEVFA